jgi:signal transduction histidine kinase
VPQAVEGDRVALATFITENLEEILEEWEVVARRRPSPDRRADIDAIRDHLGALLRAIARELETSPELEWATPEREKNTSERRETKANVETIGGMHGAGRAEQGLPLDQVIAEFPALRSCATRLWTQSLPNVTASDVRDLARFNEAVDLALTKSVSEFIRSLNRSRETFIGILGHDLRNPLSAIVAAGKMILDEPLGEDERRNLTRRVVSSGERMQRMIGDLLDFARARLGGRMPVARQPADLEKTVRDTADEFRTSNPERPVRVDIRGDLRGDWDERRIRQAIGNLLGNAIQHGAPDTAIDVRARGNETEVALSVHNEGPPIPAERREHIFEPLTGATSSRPSGGRESGHLGLGLYIAKAIATGHGGGIEVDSSAAGGTTFTLRLPR